MKKDILREWAILGVVSAGLLIGDPVSAGFFGSELTLPIVRVIDGDTIESRIDRHPPELQKISIRIRGVDTPESRRNVAKCEEEVKLGQQAKLSLKSLLDDVKVMTLKNIEWDKYGGRIVADVYVNGASVAQWMLDNRLARPYDGGTKSRWCRQP